ncbi:family 43 glycosylhydrolase [Ruania rhizosphaerae]|uniref:family 43 glycosylhydrolase n=1 Tax=Ruania rhizosphaerae TaxID=1840413 RepID=UPI00135B948F|nr:family 43 glycosylhydrolase [Ruania rhizosphaerae]
MKQQARRRVKRSGLALAVAATMATNAVLADPSRARADEVPLQEVEDCSLADLWDNRCYLAQDDENRMMGYDESMHFVDVVTVDDEYYFYGIRDNGVSLSTTKDGVTFVDRGQVLTPGEDVTYETFPGIYYEDGVFYLYTERGVFGVNDYEIQLATSTDGVNFTDQGIVLSPTPGTFDERGMGTPTMVEKDGEYYLFYHGANGTDMCNGVAIGSSPSGPFTKHSTSPVLPCGPDGTFDSGTAGKRDILLEDGVYYMIYEGSTDGVNQDFSRSAWSTGLARSTDLLTWEKFEQNPLLPVTEPRLPEDQGYGNDGPAFVQIDGATWVYYRASSGANYTKRARLTTEGLPDAFDQRFPAASLTHDIGSLTAGGLLASPGSDSTGYLVSGPAHTGIPHGENTAIVAASVQETSGPDEDVMRIEAVDASGAVVAERQVTRDMFRTPGQVEYFVLPYYLGTDADIRYRVHWDGNTELTVESMLVKYGDEDRYGLQNPRIFEAEGQEFGHQMGRVEGDGWSADPVQDTAPGYLLFGPYVSDLDPGNRAARIRIMTDDVSSDNQALVHIEVHDANSEEVLAERSIRRSDFREAGAYQDFALWGWQAPPYSSIEFRVYWHGHAYINVDRVAVDGAAPQPEYAPEASVFPSSLSQADLAGDGVTVTGTGFPGDETVTMTVEGAEEGTAKADMYGEVAFTYTADTAGAGTYEVVLESSAHSAMTSFTVQGAGGGADGSGDAGSGGTGGTSEASSDGTDRTGEAGSGGTSGAHGPAASGVSDVPDSGENTSHQGTSALAATGLSAPWVALAAAVLLLFGGALVLRVRMEA